jgi:tetratricopeptide (TPR) repeat protein
MALSLAFNAFLLVAEKVAFFNATGHLPRLEGITVFPWETVNALPVLVLVVLPFVAWMRPGIVRWIALAVIALSAVVVLPVSNGHAGYIGLAVAAAAFYVLSPAALRWWTRLSPPQRGMAIGVTLAGVIAAVAVAVAPFADALHSSGRTDLYRASWAMFLDRPILGNGPSTYSWARLIASPEAARLVQVRLTHDVPLQTLLDGGVVLGVAFFGVAVTWLTSVVRWAMPFAVRASAAALLGYAAAVTLDDFSFLPAVTAMLITLAAWSLPAATAVRGQVRQPSSWIPSVAAAVGLLIAVTFVGRVDIARVAAAAGRTSAVAGDWRAAESRFLTATAAHPEDGGYWLALGQARAELADEAGAKEAYDQARAVSPGDPRSYGALAALSKNSGDRVSLLTQAARRSYGDPQYGYRLGLELARHKDLDGAADAWGTAVTLRPDLFGVLPFAQSGVSPQAVARAAATHIASTPQADVAAGPAATFDIALALGSVTEAAPAAWRAVDAARRGDVTAARRLADQAVDADPNDARSYAALAAVAAFACDSSAQEEALAQEAATWNAYDRQPAQVAITREYTYREDSTGSMQPPSADPGPVIEMWPWSLIPERPACG